MDSLPPENNPYTASPPLANATPQRRSTFPIFPLVMFVISIAFCLLRLLIVVFGAIGVAMLMQQGEEQQPAVITGLLEVVTGAGMVLFGLLGNGLMLARKKVGFYLGWLMLLSVAGNILVGLAQLGTMFERLEPGSVEFIAATASLVVVLAIRVGLAIAYAVALVQFKKWIDSELAW